MTAAREHPSIDDAYRDVPAMVLGASGFIGRWVARALVDRGALVHGIVRNRGTAQRMFAGQGLAVNVIEADLAHSAALPALLNDVAPAIVFNLAGYGVDPRERDEAQLTALNTALVVALSDAVLRSPARRGWAGQRLIHVGSAQEYGRARGSLHESTTPEPTGPYGRSKVSATEHLRQHAADTGLGALTARLFTVYGPGEHDGRLLPALMDAKRSGRPLPLTAGDQQRDFTYVEDVADGLLRLGTIRASAGAIVNLATGRLTSVRTFAETAAGILGLPLGHLHFGSVARRSDEMDHDPVAIDRLRELTAWTPPTAIAAGIERAWAFEQARQHSHV